MEYVTRMFARPSFVDGSVGPEPVLWEYLKTVGVAFTIFQLTWRTYLCPWLIPKISDMTNIKTEKNKWDYYNYWGAIPHHLIVIPISSLVIWRLATTPLDEQVDYSVMNYASAVMLGYFVADTVDLVPNWLQGKNLDYLIHHAVGLITIFGAAAASSTALRWIPFWQIVEITSILFARMWYLRKVKKDGTLEYTVTTVTFAITYLLTRVLGMSCAVYSIMVFHPHEWTDLGWTAWLLLITCVLQYYWFSLIVKGILEMLHGKADTSKYD